MSSDFSPHDPTAHLRQSSHGNCSCSCESRPIRSIPDPTPLDELIIIHELSVDSETNLVSLVNNKTTNDEEKIQETLDLVNQITQYISTKVPFPHCPPRPTPTPAGPSSSPVDQKEDPLSSQIKAIKEEGNTAISENNFEKAIGLFSKAAEMASTRPIIGHEAKGPTNNSKLIREQLSTILLDRSTAYASANMWQEALVDAEALIMLKKKWTMGYLCKAKALKGLQRFNDAIDATLVGLEFEPDRSDLQDFLQELNACDSN